MSRTLVARCPAKINLALRVLGRRADGFHELDTVFQAIDLWDSLELREARELRLACPGSDLPVDESNLVWRAAALLRERHGSPELGATITLRKTIPVEAGLGGGSSDAAAALQACRALWSLDVAKAELEALGRELGADVPFFLTGGTARGVERGDRISPLPPVRPLTVLLGIPPFGVSTAKVFAGLRSRLTPPSIGVSLPLLSAHKWPEHNDFGFMVNDLEVVAFELRPELRRFRDALEAVGARRALLSGSGSTVYGVFEDKCGTDRGQTELSEETVIRRLETEFPGWRVVETRPIEGAVRLETGGSQGAADRDRG